MAHKVEWFDFYREPQCPANPMFPAGIDVDASIPGRPSCLVNLPYPAVRCGMYVIECETCKASAGITIAGRTDDPRSLKLACRVDAATKH